MNAVRALQFVDKKIAVSDLSQPEVAAGEVLVRVVRAGVCNTDIEITRGYFDYSGTLGHEFVGVVEKAEDAAMVGKRIVADINCACGRCAVCLKGGAHHCPTRTVLGIVNRNGAFADFLVVPERNLVMVPETVPDDIAVFAEPVAAALEIQEQLELAQEESVCVIGDGKLGLLIAMTLDASGFKVDLVGRHPERRKRLGGFAGRYGTEPFESNYAVVVEATGNPDGFRLAIQLTRPQGTLVLKSTYSSGFEFNPAMIVVNEIRVQGSRCGPMDKAVALLASGKLDLRPLIDHRFSLDDGVAAMEQAMTRGTLKVLLDIS